MAANEPLLSTRAQRAFIGTVVLQAVVVLVMVAISFKFVEEHVDYTLNRYKTLPCYLALFVLAEIFELLMALDALRLRNVIQLIGLLCFQGGMIVMAALQVHETRTALVIYPSEDGSQNYVNGGGPGTLWRKIEPFLIVSPIMIAVSWAALIFFFRELYREFGWAIFHVVGANPAMKTMYQFYQIMVCLLKFDFFAFIGVSIQLLIVVLQDNTAEFGLTVAAIPVVLILLLIAGVAVQREIKWSAHVGLASSHVGGANVFQYVFQSYGRPCISLNSGVIVYKLVRFYEPSSSEQYLSTRATLTVFTIIASLLMFATFGVGVRCFHDFDKGLQNSKMHGQYYKPVATQLRENLFGFGNAILFLQGVTWNHKYLSSFLNHPGETADRKSSYNAGTALQQRISIE
ncbi:uncharacterized protein FIBRA_01131 [Fibroporia radiculosa]|uniref:Uncharacterized protein n=1 Tax=Fibroporia radiculosa TaxID=599839 RepID=J4HST6_9APHY|nr:uncharacterized protein FIBRA_01131 [Fibroporia radiculosa]CCL99117.1 predicted protein [Fibroporia radiculosa]